MFYPDSRTDDCVLSALCYYYSFVSRDANRTFKVLDSDPELA